MIKRNLVLLSLLLWFSPGCGHDAPDIDVPSPQSTPKDGDNDVTKVSSEPKNTSPTGTISDRTLGSPVESSSAGKAESAPSESSGDAEADDPLKSSGDAEPANEPTLEAPAQCYWLSSVAGEGYVAKSGLSKTQCQQLDSCFPDGGKTSEGGCYKYAVGNDGAPEPWFGCFWLSNDTNKWESTSADEASCFNLNNCDTGGACYKWSVEP